MTVAEIIDHAKNILVIGHQRPDGDCIGAGLAFRHVCLRHGKACDFVFDSPVPEHFLFVPDSDKMNVFSASEYDTVVCVDCADHLRTGKYVGYLDKAKHTLNIDHHKTNNRFAQTNIVAAGACSTCEILFGLLDDMGEIDDNVAYWLMTGLSTDTGHFMHSNTSARVFEIAASLCRYNIDPHEIASKLYKNVRYEKTKLIARAIESMRFFADGKLCVISVRLADLQECGCVLADTEGLIDYGMMIGSVDVAVCVTEQNTPQYKVSYRSKTIDVAAAAAVFGGGGHKLAAGCSVSGKYEDVLRKVVKSVTDGFAF